MAKDYWARPKGLPMQDNPDFLGYSHPLRNYDYIL